MKSGKIALLFLLALSLSGCCSEEKLSLTLVQYNVGVFDKYEGSGVEVIARAVKEMDADAVTLNELDSCAVRTGGGFQLEEFARSMGGWSHHFASAMPFQGGAYGVGVASDPSLKIVRTDKVALPRINGYEPRAMAVVEYEDFILASAHLDLTPESQLSQIEVMNHYIDSVYRNAAKPIFIGGDFNCEPGSEPMLLMKKTWTLLSPVAYTYPSGEPRKCIDYIFARPQGRKITVRRTEVPSTLKSVGLDVASDHLPVTVTLDIE